MSQEISVNTYGGSLLFIDTKDLHTNPTTKEVCTYSNNLYIMNHCIKQQDMVIKKFSREDLQRKLSVYVHKYPNSIGSDPEFFVVDEEQKMVPAFKIFPSKELSPKIFWDGFQGEFTTPSYGCLAYHTDGIAQRLKEIWNSYLKKNNLKFSIQNTFDVDFDELRKLDPKYTEFGCSPSLNVYEMSPTIPDGSTVTTRSAGGHMHFGINVLNKHKIPDIVKSLDIVVGLLTVSLFENYDNPKRRLYYGLAGEYRLPKHGLEYRTPSNAWLLHPVINHIVWEYARRAVSIGIGGLQNIIFDVKEEEVVAAINNTDVELARKIIRGNFKQFKNITKDLTPGSWDLIHQSFLEGVDILFDDVPDIVKNWQLNSEWVVHCGKDNTCIANSSLLNNKPLR